MKIVHFADVHIGVENYSQIDPETGFTTRLVDFLNTLDEVVDYSIDNNADLALFCGDAYKSRDPNQTQQREFAKRISRLSSAGIPVFLLVGNHDMPFTANRASSLEIFDTLDVQNVYTGDRLETYMIQTKSGPVQVLALPWIRRSVYLTRDETSGMTPEQINESIQSRLTEIIRVQVENLNSEIPAIFSGHVSVSEAFTSSEQSMMLGRDHIILRSNIALPQLEYVALGHIHRHQEWGNQPRVVYSGSLQRVDFGEEKDEKGFCVIELDPSLPQGEREINFEFIQVNARKFTTISIDIKENDTDPMNTVIETIKSHDINDAIVRILIKVPSSLEGHLIESDIRESLENAHYIATISKESLESARTRLGEGVHAQTLEPGEALKRYLKNRDLSPERTKILIEHATELMEESSD